MTAYSSLAGKVLGSYIMPAALSDFSMPFVISSEVCTASGACQPDHRRVRGRCHECREENGLSGSANPGDSVVLDLCRRGWISGS